MKTRLYWFPFNVQYFAAAGDPPAGDPPPADAAETAPPAKDPTPKLPTFDELMKNPAYQAEFDRRQTKAQETARAKWEKEQGLTADQLAAQKTKEREDALAAREKAQDQRDLKNKAIDMLASKKLPTRLANRLDYSGDEAAMIASLTEVETDFRASLEESVNERLKGTPPPAGTPADPADAALRKAAGLPATPVAKK